MNKLSQKIKENEREFNKKFNEDTWCGCGGEYNSNSHRNRVNAHLHSSTLDILDTIERWADEEKSKLTMKWDNDKAQSWAYDNLINFIREAKKEI